MGKADAPKHVFDTLATLKQAVITAKEVAEAVAAEKRRMQAEHDRIMAIKNVTERDASIVRMKVVDTIFTLRCPGENCGMAFLDFEGCFALTCNNCRCGFCAWCLKDCGRDAHAHVPHCPEGKNGDVYGSKKEFDDHHRGRKAQGVRALLRDKEGDVRDRALQLLQKDLEDLGIAVEEVEVR